MAKNKIACALSVAAVTACGAGFLSSAGAWADGEYDLIDCIVNGTEDVCTLTSDTTMNDWVQPMRNLTIDLNGCTLTTNKAFTVYGTELNIKNGTIEETDENVIPFYVYGSKNENVNNFTVLNISSDVIIRSPYYGLFVPNFNNHAYGVVINFGGRLEAQDGITINGNIQDAVANAPQVNILDGASIVADGHPIYAAGYGHWNIGAATISGSDGVGIKAGTFNFTNTSVTATGEFKVPEGYNNGIYSAGVPIQIESNDGYADHVEISINGGEYVSEQGAVVLEYKAKADTQNTVKSFEITGGTFTAGGDENIFHVSDGFTLTGFVSGGTLNKAPEAKYIAEGKDAYSLSEDGPWVVDDATEVKLPEEVFVRAGEKIEVGLSEIAKKYGTFGSKDQSIVKVNGSEATAEKSGKTEVSFQLHNLSEVDESMDVIVYEENDDDAAFYVATVSDEIDEEDLNEEVVTKIKDLASGGEVVGYYEINAVVMDEDGNQVSGLIPETDELVLVTVDMPEGLAEVADGYVRKYYMIRYHNGEVTKIEAFKVGDDKVGFYNDKFSTFALIYEDEEEEPAEEEAATPDTGTVTAAGASASVAVLMTAVAVGILTSIVSFAYLIRRKN